ncbi:hypothetical protein C8R44DRAFT_796616 [Mycena epipterygia]|nr:hypothetical protein C8R44DRAFT_796616 [Mycena epipterygia]
MKTTRHDLRSPSPALSVSALYALLLPALALSFSRIHSRESSRSLPHLFPLPAAHSTCFCSPLPLYLPAPRSRSTSTSPLPAPRSPLSPLPRSMRSRFALLPCESSSPLPGLLLPALCLPLRTLSSRQPPYPPSSPSSSSSSFSSSPSYSGTRHRRRSLGLGFGFFWYKEVGPPRRRHALSPPPILVVSGRRYARL